MIEVVQRFIRQGRSAPEDVAEPRLLVLFDRPLVHAVAEGAGAAAGRGDRPHARLGVLLDHPGEDLEARAAEVLGDVGHHDGVAQVGLVGAVLGDRLVVGDAREAWRHRLGSIWPASGRTRKLLEQAAHDGLDGLEHILLLDEAHLQVELVELTRRTIGAGVLVAEAGRDLEVAVEARDHDQLLELLRRLRQGVELAGMHARGDEEVARALGRRGGQDGGLELEKARVAHAPADRGDDLVAEHDVPVQRLAAQIQEAIGEAQVLRVVGLAEHGDGQLLGLGQHLDAGGDDLDLARRQLGVHRGLAVDHRARAHAAVDLDHPLGAHRLCRLEGWAVGIGDDLGEAVVVAQVDEQQAAVVAHAVHPARQPHRLADVARAQASARVGAIAVHAPLARPPCSLGGPLAAAPFAFFPASAIRLPPREPNLQSNRGKAHAVRAMSRLPSVSRTPVSPTAGKSRPAAQQVSVLRTGYVDAGALAYNDGIGAWGKRARNSQGGLGSRFPTRRPAHLLAHW